MNTRKATTDTTAIKPSRNGFHRVSVEGGGVFASGLGIALGVCESLIAILFASIGTVANDRASVLSDDVRGVAPARAATANRASAMPRPATHDRAVLLRFFCCI